MSAMDAEMAVGTERPDLTQSYRENGFVVFRAAYSPDEIEEMRQKAIIPALGEAPKAALTDAIRRVPSASYLVCEAKSMRLLKPCIGDGAKFLQVADIHVNHNAFGWHRDSAGRTLSGPDWNEEEAPYTCAKQIIYVDCDDFGLEVIPGSHRFKIPKSELKAANDPLVLSRQSASIPAYRYDKANWRPVVVEVSPGDTIIFDLRLLHRGHPNKRSVLPEDSRAASTMNKYTPNKSTISLCYGQDNFHSQRFHAYFRYHRLDSGYRDLPPAVTSELKARNALLSTHDRCFFDERPDARMDLFVSPKLRSMLGNRQQRSLRTRFLSRGSWLARLVNTHLGKLRERI